MATPVRAETQSITKPVRQRTHKGGQLVDRFHVDKNKIPEGTSYEWKTQSVFGKVDTAMQAFEAEQGWTPVPAERHPEMVPKDHKGPIIRDGMILMERPMELTQEAMNEDRAAAREVMRSKQEQLGMAPPGTMPRARANGTAEFNSITTEVVHGGAIEVPS